MRFLFISFSLLTLLLTACSDSSDRPQTPPPPTITALSVEPPRSELDVGTSQSFRAIAGYSDGSIADVTPSASWSLDIDNGTLEVQSDPAQSGRFQVGAVIPGEETVRASIDGREAFSRVSVVEVPLTRIEIEPASAEVLVGTDFTFAATGFYDDGRTQDITEDGNWASSDPTVASVSPDGIVTGESAGSAAITVSLESISESAAVEVSPQVELESVEVSPTDVRLFLEGSQQFSARANYSDGSSQIVTKDVLWISSDTSVVAQDNFRKGLFLARGEGVAEITAEYGINNVGTTSVSVERVVVTSIVVSPRDASLLEGETRRYFTEAVRSDGTLFSVNQSDDQFYEVGNPAVAYISNNPANKGVLTALMPGTTTVVSTFTFEGEEFTAQGTLTVCAPEGC